jgi:uncharacterized protein DUF2188
MNGDWLAARRNLHVEWWDGYWRVRRQSADRARSRHRNRANAVRSARALAMRENVYLVLHDQWGNTVAVDDYTDS